MKQHRYHLDTLFLDAFEKLWCEVKSCGRSGGRALLFGIDSLVTLLFGSSRGYIWGKGHLSDLVDSVVGAHLFGRKLDYAVSFLGHVRDLACHKSVTENYTRPDLAFLSRLYKCLPNVAAKAFQQQHLYICAGVLAFTVKTGGNDAGAVQHENITFAQVFDYIAEMLVSDLTRRLIEYHKARHIPFFRGNLSDKLFGKVVIKVRGLKIGLSENIFYDLRHIFV